MRLLRHFSHVSFLHARRGISRLAGEGKDQERPSKSLLEPKYASSLGKGGDGGDAIGSSVNNQTGPETSF
jgi:hypothetical protein